MVTEELNKEWKEENENARERYHMEGIRLLFKAVGMQAIKDYGKAYKRLMKGDDSKMFDGKTPETVMDECKQYFGTDQFKAIFGITDPEEVCKKAIEYQDELENMKNMNEEERNKYVDELLHKKAV